MKTLKDSVPRMSIQLHSLLPQLPERPAYAIMPDNREMKEKTTAFLLNSLLAYLLG